MKKDFIKSFKTRAVLIIIHLDFAPVSSLRRVEFFLVKVKPRAGFNSDYSKYFD